MKKLIWIAIIISSLQGCTKFLDKQPFASITPDKVFSNASDMALYVNSLYINQIPTGNDIAQGDGNTDYISSNNIPSMMQASTTPDNIGGWSWTTLRNINYFLDNAAGSTIDNTVKSNYIGIARFFRAWFYYGMVKTYGDVPWYSHAMDPADSALYKPRDSRVLVMDSVVADLDYAIANITLTKDNGCSNITKMTALALKARVCLFEGTFRKYHTELNLTATANDYLNAAVAAATQIMSAKQYSLHNTNSPYSDYRSLFTTETPFFDEIILARIYNNSLKLWNNLNAIFYSTTLSGRYSPTKQFIDTYLNLDGSRFTDQPMFDTIFFVNEMKNRDPRLQQTVRCNGYKYSDGTSAPPDYAYTFTGYQIMKYSIDNKLANTSTINNNSIPIFRYAEVLLNYAEAKAELGQFTATDWNNTIKLIRQRAGIQNSNYPTVIDSYLQTTYFPDIADAALLEIRRERGTELFCEGLRFDDIRRWKEGPMMSLPYLGVYVPQLNKPYAMNGDGVLNVSFVTAAPSSKQPGVVYDLVAGSTISLTNGSSGNIHWLYNMDSQRKWNDKYYYQPIPTSQIVLNPALTQSPGW
ncbi:RagB/SusD family nutrient uptake outer membrane protein [Asinibacterium sp. OR53]|uniref:RagB/SusD family nutrient uptake outer membrane protein n=1 Tax=Asinibacterium sp. OR53 TaxID=925409 RepID=UPI000478DA8C|nr:RagB/SusD family nutrient uptake outer membrane protein [Asinibacterium sp. OR53]